MTREAGGGVRLARSGTLELTATLGALVPASVDVVSANLTTIPSLSVRFFHGVYDVGLFLALGLGIDLATFGVRTLARGGRRTFFLLEWAVCTVLTLSLLERNLARQADVLFDGRFREPLLYVLAAAGGAGVPIGRAVGAWLGKRRRLFALGAALALGGAIANVSLLRDDYQEPHTAVAIVAALVAGASLRPSALRLAHARSSSLSRRLAIVAAVTALLTTALPPSNAVRLALFQSPGCAGAWVAALQVWRLPEQRDAAPAGALGRWLARRDGARPPSAERLVGAAPVVVLVTIDAVRADVIADDARTDEWPAYRRLKREGAVFAKARAPGSQTSVSLTALFAGKYFSEMRWERYGTGKSRFDYPAGDPTPRLPALLSAAGVSTYKAASLVFLTNEFGVAPGFEEEDLVTEGRRHARASEVVTPLVNRLRKVRGDEPFFGFVHLTEPHAPYDRGSVKTGSQFERYVSEIGETDRYLAKIMTALSSYPVAGRSVLVVTSDHGEAFGEHGTHQHTKTIYEELVRVPLLVWGAGVRPRTIDEPVSLVDLHPTLLDVFGVEGPDDVTGESLVPLLAGREQALTRPILAEGRLRRASYAGDAKVIVDLRRNTIEAFDLRQDPNEERNLYDEDPSLATAGLATLKAYYDAREYKAVGYETPYKP